MRVSHHLEVSFLNVSCGGALRYPKDLIGVLPRYTRRVKGSLDDFSNQCQDAKLPERMSTHSLTVFGRKTFLARPPRFQAHPGACR